MTARIPRPNKKISRFVKKVRAEKVYSTVVRPT
jgi:hypothetical protein